jgi:hypothetical protein
MTNASAVRSALQPFIGAAAAAPYLDGSNPSGPGGAVPYRDGWNPLRPDGAAAWSRDGWYRPRQDAGGVPELPQLDEPNREPPRHYKKIVLEGVKFCLLFFLFKIEKLIINQKKLNSGFPLLF